MRETRVGHWQQEPALNFAEVPTTVNLAKQAKQLYDDLQREFKRRWEALDTKAVAFVMAKGDFAPSDLVTLAKAIDETNILVAMLDGMAK